VPEYVDLKELIITYFYLHLVRATKTHGLWVTIQTWIYSYDKTVYMHYYLLYTI